MSEKADYKDTVFLPKTDFPMRAGLAQKEPAILKRWQEEDLYGQLRRERAGRERFLLHDGPPYANGDIHMGHALNKVLKDIIVRAQTLLGKDAPYVPGWDCHGLPIEWKIEEQYRKKKKNKDEVPAVEFRQQCRDYAAKWVGVQREQFERLGVMGDWDDPYLTMKFEAEAAIVAELLKFAESGQLYRGAKPVMWSPVEKTALAEAEVEYEDILSTQIDVAFEIVEAPNAPELVGAHAVIWTTTPWTIPVNQALAYGEGIEYVMVDAAGRKLLVAEALLSSFLARHSRERGDASSEDASTGESGSWTPDQVRGDIEVLWRGKGSDLAGAKARHPMAGRLSPLPFRGGAGGGGSPGGAADGDSPHPNPSPEGEGLKGDGFFERLRPLLAGDFVTTDAGTGLVHLAPDHGEDDFDLCKANGIGPVFAVDASGLYRDDWPWLGGDDDRRRAVINNNFLAPDGPICSDLRDAGALLSAKNDESTRHSYPHSWRSKAKVIYRCTPQWFIPMDRPTSATGLKSSATRQWEDEGGARLERHSHPHSAPESNGPTLRNLALNSVEMTRWVPTKSENRIRSMVEGRPDWVISRQRAWGVPIALYVNRKSGEYLHDAEVNARILEAFRKGGADAWFDADHQALLGPDHALADYEIVTDILDVWFDSGSTHSFVLDARYGEGTIADLYLEGSDQHRGWFQSSLLEASGTRGRAPYKTVLTHGFALDKTGRKMSKSDGNVVDPLKIIGESGADILRLWVASVDYFEDVRIGDEILKGTSDAYRKLRNSFRYLLGALDGYDPAEAVAIEDMPELERYVLHLLAELDAKLRAEAEGGWTFARYARALTDFANEDLSAFYFDIRKDCLYCDVNVATGAETQKRAAYRTVLHTLFEALVRYAAPLIPFTAEEVWQSRYPDTGSVHLLKWPSDVGRKDEALATRWIELRKVRSLVTRYLESERREKIIRSSLEAEIKIEVFDQRHLDALHGLIQTELEELFIVSDVTVTATIQKTGGTAIGMDSSLTHNHKCGRCWRHLPEVEEDGALCGRCEDVLEMGQ